MSVVIPTRFRLRRDTAANWASVNPVLLNGEPALETDTRKVKYGDGETAWNSLAYAIGNDVQVLLDGLSSTQGAILYRGASDWAALSPGTTGQVLRTGGAAANPSWANAGWETLEAWNFDADGATAAVIATGTENFDQIHAFARAVTKSDNTTLVLHVSTDGGSTWYSTSGDYVTVDSAGNEGAVGQPRLHATNATAARTGWATIQFNNQLPALPLITSNGDASQRLFVADTANPINAVRVVPNGLTGTFTGGAVTIVGRRKL